MVIKVILFVLFIICIFIFGGLAIWKWYSVYDDEDCKPIATVFTILSIVFLLITICIPGNIHQVNSGEVAVIRKLGKVDGIRDPGIYWDWYFTTKYEMFNTKVRQLDIETSTYSKDNQTIAIKAELQYTIDPANADRIAIEYGTISKLESKINAIAYDNIKAVFSQNTATDVITNRAKISSDITNEVSNSIGKNYYVNIKTIVMTNIDFTDDFEAAVAAKVAQEQKYQQALIEQKQSLASAENEKQIEITKAEAAAQKAKLDAEAQAEVAKIQAEADKIVAQIAADSAEYQGKKEAAIALQKLASVNGWTVVTMVDTTKPVLDDNGEETGKYVTINKLLKSSGVEVTKEELEAGVQTLVKVYYTEKWDGKLPVYTMGADGSISMLLPTPTE